MGEADIHERHNKCYMKARNAIISLGKSNLDSEGSCMLDITMMEYATETNRLDDIRRCLLCQRKEKLVRSHICPHSILKVFGAGATHPENLQVFETSSESSKVGRLKSPKQVTTYAFCKGCEKNLSTYGEQEFVPHFFHKIYSAGVPSNYESEQCIEYGPWLYHFCVGMLFRALIKNSISSFFNSDEVYEFFLMCRSVLLNPSLQHKSNCVLPHIYILFGPHKSNDQDQQYGFMNQVLTDYYSTIQTSSLLDGSAGPPYPAHYVLVHIGVINIIAIFSPSRSCILPAECQVNPIDGVFRVPAEKDRGNSFPPGLWGFYRLYALERSNLWLERSMAPLKRSMEQMTIKPPASLDAVFHVEASVKSDIALFKTNTIPSPDPKYPRIITLLPAGFHFQPCPNPNCIRLPDSHRILFHLAKGAKEVYFLAVGHDKSFNLSTPYVLYSLCEPGLLFCCAFFIDPTHLTFKEFLPFWEGQALLERVVNVNELKANIQDTLRKMLRCKGVDCLTDILQICQVDNSSK